jgi:phage-related protein (TIGR01555 family)
MANILRLVRDGLVNAVTGIGTSADPRNASRYAFCPLSAHQIEAAYRGSGMMRKCIDIPALDMVRAWRDWQADDADIEMLEAEEARLGLRQKIYEAEILRGLGGGAIIIGVPGLPGEPMPAIVRSCIAFLHVISRYQITLGPVDMDPLSANYGQPAYFTVNDGAQTRIHPSRVICFTGDPIPQLINTAWEDRFWGESRIQRLMGAVKNSDTAQDAFAALLHKARVTRVGIPDLLSIVSDADGEAAIANRLSAMAMGESIHNATLFDSGNGASNPGESITDYQVNWAGMDTVMAAFDQRLCAVADIPATRLLGQSPGGLNASGNGQQQDWHKHVSAMQELRLRPCIDKLDVALIPSATGKVVDKSIWYQWAALDVPDEKTVAEVNKLNIESAVKAQETGAIPDAVFAEGFQSLMVESGLLPALETALEKVAESERFGIVQEGLVEGVDPSALTGEPVGA